MKNKTNKFLMPKLAFLVFALSAAAVFAATNETVSRALDIARPEVKIEIAGVVARGGKIVSLEKTEAVRSGETLDWTIDSANAGAGDAKNYRVVGQIPAGTLYVAGSASGDDAPSAAYSIDGGKTFSAQPLIEEKQADGSVKQVPAPAALYTQIRFEWAKDLASHSRLAARYRVRVK